MTRSQRRLRSPRARPSPARRTTLGRGFRAVASSRGDRVGRRTTLTGRAAILAAVVAVLAVSLAYPARQYLSQRAEIDRLDEQVEERQQSVAELEAERARWDDPAYIRSQARDRLHYCMPDETCYVTIDGEPTPTPSGDASR